jgi:hypothetical protein
MMLVSFWGTSPHRHRVLDVYDRRTLGYRGSVLFPYEIDHIAVHGDTLAVTAEVEDEPVVEVFLLGRREGRDALAEARARDRARKSMTQRFTEGTQRFTEGGGERYEPVEW